MAADKKRYRAYINGDWEYVFATSTEKAKKLLKRRGRDRGNGHWNCTDFQVEKVGVKNSYDRISFGFELGS